MGTAELSWFECKVALDRTGKDGMTKKVTETYLLAAVSYTDAEAVIAGEMRPYATGGFEVADIRRRRTTEVLPGDGDRWYRAKINIVTFNETDMRVRRSSVTLMVQAADFNTACTRVRAWQTETVQDTETVKVEETPILAVYGPATAN